MVVTINKSRTNQKPKLILRGGPPRYNNDENLVDHDAYFDTHEPYISPFWPPPTSLSSQDYEEIQEVQHIYDDHYPQEHSYHHNTTQDFPPKTPKPTHDYTETNPIALQLQQDPETLQLVQLSMNHDPDYFMQYLYDGGVRVPDDIYEREKARRKAEKAKAKARATSSLHQSYPSTSYKSLSQPIYHSYQPNTSIPQTYSTITLPQTSQVQIPTHASSSHIPCPLTLYLQQQSQKQQALLQQQQILTQKPQPSFNTSSIIPLSMQQQQIMSNFNSNPFTSPPHPSIPSLPSPPSSIQHQQIQPKFYESPPSSCQPSPSTSTNLINIPQYPSQNPPQHEHESASFFNDTFDKGDTTSSLESYTNPSTSPHSSIFMEPPSYNPSNLPNPTPLSQCPHKSKPSTLPKPNPSLDPITTNPIIPPPNPNPNPVVHLSDPNPTPIISNPIILPLHSTPTPSTIILHPLYCPSTRILMKDVIHWLLARNQPPSSCHQIPIQEPLNVMPISPIPSSSPQIIQEPSNVLEDPPAINLIHSPPYIESIQETSIPIQTQDLCQGSNLKHGQLCPLPNQDQSSSFPPVHNLYLFYDQDIICDQELLTPSTHGPNTIHVQETSTILIHHPTISTSLDETLGPHKHIDNQANTSNLHEHNEHKQDPIAPSLSHIDSISTPPSHPISLGTFIHECSLMGEKKPLSTTSPSNNELKSSSQSTPLKSSSQSAPSPIVHRILQNMNYQGKGLGLHEQGTLEPIHVKVSPKPYGIGYTPRGKQYQDVGTTFLPPKSTPSKPKLGAPHRTHKTYVSIPPPSSYKPKKHETIHPPPSTLPPLLPTPNILPSTLPPLLPTPNIPILQSPYHFGHKLIHTSCSYKSPTIPNHDQQMHTSNKHEAILNTPMGFKNKNLDASTHKAKNPNNSHAIWHKCEESKKNQNSKMLPKSTSQKDNFKTKMVWVIDHWFAA